MNGYIFYQKIQNASNVREMLQNIQGKTLAETQSKRGNLFEKLWDIIIKFGFCPKLPNDTFIHYEGNINNCHLKKVSNLEMYLQHMSIFSKGEGGSSDITLQNKHTHKWTFMSSKYYLDDSKKSIDSFDVEKIMAIVSQYSYKYNSYEIYLLVHNKQKVLNLIKNSQSTNNYIKENIHNIFDIDDLEVFFQQFKQSIQNVSINELNNLFNNEKIPLSLRFHQELITHKILNKIDTNHKNILIGAKARSGKTYCVGGILIKYYKKFKILNSLIITPAPNETISQFTNDMFHKFRDFNNINIVEINKGSDIKKLTLQSNNIIIISKQLLDSYVLTNTITKIKALNLNIIVFDENHFHGTTQMSKDIFNSYSSLNTVKIYLTATFVKPLNEWNIPETCQIYWNIEDEQLCKKRDISGLINKHGEDVLLFVNNDNKERILCVYDKMPDMCILTNMFDFPRYKLIKERIQDTSYGFSMETLLSMTNDGNNFNFTSEVDDVLKFISGKGTIDKEENPIRDTNSIFERIKYISNIKNSRTKLNNENFNSQLWFLPYGKNMLIDNVSICLKNRMLKNRVLSKYEIMIVNSKKYFKLKDVKEEIKNKELEAKQNNKSGLIILAGNQLTLGISLDLVDIVVLFTNIMACDKIVQMMYRGMTETVHNEINDFINNDNKTIGFVVDLNISRVVNIMMKYKIHKQLPTNEKIKYLIENNLINIDMDIFQHTENKTDIINKLFNIWKSDSNNIKHILKQIEENIIDINIVDQQKINQYFALSTNERHNNTKIEFNENTCQLINSGKYITKQSQNNKESENDNDDVLQNISLTKDILPFIIPLGSILTINYKVYEFDKIIDIIKTNSNLLEIFNDQIYNWWKIKNMMNFIENIVNKYIKSNSSIYEISYQFKTNLNSLLDSPLGFIELINNCLKPKQTERQENGMVFTPINIIENILNNLNAHYIKENKKSIFEDLTLKWSSMGNFSVVLYLKLMDGLALQIIDPNERKQYILENMMYITESNKKNAYIYRLIFNNNNNFKINLYEGDELNLNIKSTWNIEHFDIILENPPYNKGGIRSHTGKKLGDKNETIWTKFVKKNFESLKPNGYLISINPLSWLKHSHSLHKCFLEKHIIHLDLWDNSQSKLMLNADIPISLIILKNTINHTHKLTEIKSILKRKKLSITANVYLSFNHSIPLCYHSIFNKLTRFIEKHNLHLEYKTKTVKSVNPQIKIPINITVDDMWAVDTFTIKDGLIVKKATEMHPDANKKKIIISNKSSLRGSFIDEGILGLTGNHKFYILGQQLNLIYKLLNFKIIDIICQYTKYGQDFLDNEIFNFIPDIRKLNLNDITEESFYQLIELSFEEINQISNNTD
jgi:hypothetical protein